MILGVVRETGPGEERVALVADSVKRLTSSGLEIVVQAGAGEAAGVADADYQAAGARMERDAERVWSTAALVAKIAPPAHAELALLREGSALVGLLAPFANLELVRALAARRITSFSLDLLPRITRAQAMDVLSSMSTISGYKAVILAADLLPKLFPMLTTAGGTLKAARVLVIGAGVAGLQAIATARRLGAVVEAFDIRAAAKEQVQSLGARFVEDPQAVDAEGAGGYAKEQTAEQQTRQRQLLSDHIATADAVICTALVPGRRAPVLVSEDQVKRMRRGSVIVDLAAEQGGNCTLTRPGEIVDHDGVRISGPLNLPGRTPVHASQMFSRNLLGFLLHLCPKGELVVDTSDEITAGTLVTRDGEITNAAVRTAAQG